MFSVIATNETAPNLGYQWRLNEVAIVGATNSTFNIGSASPADQGSYTVAVTNAAGRTISYPAVLTVAPAAPVITTQPTPQLTTIGGNATFTVAVDGIACLGSDRTDDAGGTDGVGHVVDVGDEGEDGRQHQADRNRHGFLPNGQGITGPVLHRLWHAKFSPPPFPPLSQW